MSWLKTWGESKCHFLERKWKRCVRIVLQKNQMSEILGGNLWRSYSLKKCSLNIWLSQMLTDLIILLCHSICLFSNPFRQSFLCHSDLIDIINGTVLIIQITVHQRLSFCQWQRTKKVFDANYKKNLRYIRCNNFPSTRRQLT